MRVCARNFGLNLRVDFGFVQHQISSLKLHKIVKSDWKIRSDVIFLLNSIRIWLKFELFFLDPNANIFSWIWIELFYLRLNRICLELGCDWHLYRRHKWCASFVKKCAWRKLGWKLSKSDRLDWKYFVNPIWERPLWNFDWSKIIPT